MHSLFTHTTNTDKLRYLYAHTIENRKSCIKYNDVYDTSIVVDRFVDHLF